MLNYEDVKVLEEENVPKLRWSRLRMWGLLLMGILLLSGCELSGHQSTFDAAAPIARQQMSLLYYTFWLSLIVMVGVGGALIYAIVKYRRPAGDTSLPPQTHGNVMVEVGLILLATLITILVIVPAVRVIWQTSANVTPTEDDIIINVVGYQWWWAFEYPELGIVTANEMHIPQGRRVILNLDSADVLHSFWVPKLAGKMDLIPNQANQLWFTTDEDTPLDVYYGQCAELCLGAHAYMRFRVIVSSEEDYAAWVSSFQDIEPLAAGQQLQQLQSDPLVQQGAELFRNKCASCHAVKGAFGGAADKPDLTNFGLRTSVAAGVLANTPENLARWLRDPQEVKPGNYMPYIWSETDPNREEHIEALVAYLLSLGITAESQAQTSPGGNYGD